MTQAQTPTQTATLGERLKFLFLGEKALSSVSQNGRGWFTIIKESFTGAWQQNVELSADTVLSYHAVFACITLISQDISKLPIQHQRRNPKTGIWEDIKTSRLADLLKRPNGYQNMMQFVENFISCKASRGNTYILKRRNRAGKVVGLYVMDPDRTTVLVSDNGQVFYTFNQDNLSGVLTGGITVPASEVIHDRYNCLFHPLVGLSPIYASSLAASQGIRIQRNSSIFFGNMSRPSGMLTAAGAISNETAARLQESFETNYSGENMGKIAVAGDGLEFKPFTITAEDSQLVEQQKLSSDVVCSTYHVPKFMVMGDSPSYNNIDALGQQYFSQCLQAYIVAFEHCMGLGLDLPSDERLAFDIDHLIRMDNKTQIETLKHGVDGGIYTPNDARLKLNKKPLPGGDEIYLQQQDVPMSIAAKQNSLTPPSSPAPLPSPPNPPAPAEEDNTQKQLAELVEHIKKEARA